MLCGIYFNMAANSFRFILKIPVIFYSPTIWFIFDLAGFLFKIKVIFAGNLCSTTTILNGIVDRSSHWL